MSISYRPFSWLRWKLFCNRYSTLLSRKLALAPIDDEPLSEDDRLAIAEAEEWLDHNEPIPLETVLADFGLSMTDWEAMAKTPLSEENSKRNA